MPAVVLDGHRRADDAAVGPDALADRPGQLRVGPAADAGLGVGRDVGGMGLERRLVEHHAARQSLLGQRLALGPRWKWQLPQATTDCIR
jgi:hypothetical protein